MTNVTLSLDEVLLRKARVKAAHEHTSVNAVVRAAIAGTGPAAMAGTLRTSTQALAGSFSVVTRRGETPLDARAAGWLIEQLPEEAVVTLRPRSTVLLGRRMECDRLGRGTEHGAEYGTAGGTEYGTDYGTARITEYRTAGATAGISRSTPRASGRSNLLAGGGGGGGGGGSSSSSSSTRGLAERSAGGQAPRSSVYARACTSYMRA